MNMLNHSLRSQRTALLLRPSARSTCRKKPEALFVWQEGPEELKPSSRLVLSSYREFIGIIRHSLVLCSYSWASFLSVVKVTQSRQGSETEQRSCLSFALVAIQHPPPHANTRPLTAETDAFLQLHVSHTLNHVCAKVSTQCGSCWNNRLSFIFNTFQSDYELNILF